MHKGIFALLFMLGIGAGIGASQLSRSTEPDLRSSVSRGSGSDEEGEVPSSATDSSTSVNVLEDGSGDKESEVLTSVSLDAVLREYPVGTWERGAGEITGSVLTVDGEPLVGAKVKAIIWGTTPGVEQAPIHETPLLEYLATEIEQFHYDQAMITYAVTDTDGAFVLEGLKADAQYHAYVLEPGWWCHAPNYRRLSPGESCEFIAYRTAPVELRVVRPGTPVLTGAVWVGHSHDGRRFESWIAAPDWHRERPIIELPTGVPYLMFGTALGQRSELVPIALEPGVPSVVEVSLAARSILRVTVERPVDVPVFEATVVLRSPSEDEDEESGWLSQADVGSWSGEAILVAPTAGLYRVELLRDYDKIQAVDFEIRDGENELRFPAPPIDRSRCIAVRASGPDGRPVAGVEFGAEYQTDHMFGTSRPESHRLADGTYWIELGDRRFSTSEFEEESWPTAVTLTGTSPQYGSASVVVPLDHAPTAELRFTAPAYVVMDLSEITSRWILNRATLSLGSHTVGPIGGRRRVRLGPVAPGEHEVGVALASGRWESTPVHRIPVQLESGDNDVRLQLPTWYRLTVLFEVSEPGAAVTAYPADPAVADGRRSAMVRKGRAVLECVPAGRYRLHHDGDTMEVDVFHDREIDFRATRFDCLEVEITDHAGPLATWGLRTGDKIIAIDGQTLDHDEIRWASMAFRAIGRRRLTVERAGSSVEIEFTVNDAVQDFGGSIEPAQR